MGHINAGLEWLIQSISMMAPLVLATFMGAWLAFQHFRHQEKRKESETHLRTLKHISFVLTSQLDQLQRLKTEILDPHLGNSRRGFVMQSVLIHSQFPSLDMSELPSVFNDDEYSLVNDITQAEQKFKEITDLLHLRVDRLVEYDIIDDATEHQIRRKAALEKSINKATDRIFTQVDDALVCCQSVLSRLSEHLNVELKRRPSEILENLSWFFLAGAFAVIGVFFFSHWAVNSELLVQAGLDIALVSAIVFASSLYASLAVGLMVAILTLFSFVKRMQSSSIYLWTFMISLQPTLFLLWFN